MQVDRKPNRRPYGLMLVCLLVLCLSVPRYWRARNAARQGPDVPSQADRGMGDSETVAVPPAAARSLTSPDETVLRDEALFAELIFPLNRWLTTSTAPREPQWAESTLPTVTAAGRLVTSWLRCGGRQLAQCSPDDLAALVARLVELHRASLAESAADRPAAEAPSLRLTSPRDRLAMAPRVEKRLPSLREPPDQPPPARSEAIAWPWTRPVTLVEQLELVAECPYAADWAQKTNVTLSALTDTDPPGRQQAAVLLGRLSQLADEAVRLADSAEDDRLRVEVLRAHWGLARRIDCWSRMYEIGSTSAAPQRVASRGSLQGLLDNSPDAGVDLHSLSAGMETYEQTREPPLARAVRTQQRQLLASDDANERDLGEALEAHYRNANVRIAVTAELLNRYLSQERVEVRPVHDRIVGTPVCGRSETSAQTHVRLEPAAGLLHLELETDGVVHSNTLADGGQAIVHSRATTDFWVNKPIVVDRQAVRLQPTTADAENHAQLVGVRTNFDWIPLLGAYVRARAVEEYHAKRPQAKAEVECKVAARAARRVDSEASDAVERVEQEVQERFTGRLAEYGVTLTPLELTTTSKRVIARLRLASDDQLGAHSPRPRAPADSLASLQVHESALSNAAVALELDGKRLTAPELQQMLRAKFPRLAEQRPAQEAHEDTVFGFANRDAVQFHVADGRVELTLALQEFVYEGRTMRNFIVHAFYRPEVNGLEANLVRDGALGIEGRLGAGDRARLHSVFKTVLSEDRTIPIVHLDNRDDPRLAGLMITQLVLEDGWLGLAVGPTTDGRVAQRWRSLR